MGHCTMFMQQCVRSKYLWAFIVTIIVFVSGCFFFEYLSDHKDNHAILHRHTRFCVRNATLTHLTYTNTTNTLRYDLTLHLAVPIKLATLEYMRATASYHNITFASQPDEALMNGFTGLKIHFSGELAITLNATQHSDLDSDNISGLYNISVKLWPPKLSTPDQVLCDLQFPVSNSVFCTWINA